MSIMFPSVPSYKRMHYCASLIGYYVSAILVGGVSGLTPVTCPAIEYSE